MFGRKHSMAIAAVAALGVLLWISVVEIKGAENDLLDTITAGIARNDSLITNISFDYAVDYNHSEEWRAKRFELYERHMVKDVLEGMEMRTLDLERTLRTGSAIFEGNKFKIASKWIFLSDQKVFLDEIVTCDGIKLTELNLKENAAYISDELEKRKGHLTFDPRNFPVVFVEAQPLPSALTAPDTNTIVLGTEQINDTNCYVIEMIESFMTPEGSQKQARRKCWIASDKGLRIKKAIAYDIESLDKPLSITQCELTEVAKGIWYYSKVTFESYPLSLPKPDVIEVLQLNNIVINQQFKENDFKVSFPEGCYIDDEVAGRKYRVGEDPNAPKSQSKK